MSGLLNVELMQILKFDIARIKAVECFHLLAFLAFCLYFNHFKNIFVTICHIELYCAVRRLVASNSKSHRLTSC